MSLFGSTLFSGSSFIRRALTPVLLVFAIGLPLLLDIETPLQYAVLAAMEVACVALLAGLWLRAPYSQWAFRFLSAVVFLAYAGYVVDEFFFSEHPITLDAERSEASPINAIAGLVIIGIPSLTYAVFGRFSVIVRRELNDRHHLGPGDHFD